MTREGCRVLHGVAELERKERTAVLPLKRIAMTVLHDPGGDLASRVLGELDREGCVATNTMGWQVGWLTARGRALAKESA